MKLSESMKMWEKYGLNNKTEIRTLHINNLMLSMGVPSYERSGPNGIWGTYKDLQEGDVSRTPNKPVNVIWIREENKFLVTDGYHRILEKCLRGETEILCEVEWTGYCLSYPIPKLNERFNISCIKLLKERNYKK